MVSLTHWSSSRTGCSGHGTNLSSITLCPVVIQARVSGLTCIRPVIAGPKSDSTPFQASVTIYMHNARAGRLSGNLVFWRCSAFDLDGERRTSSRRLSLRGVR